MNQKLSYKFRPLLLAGALSALFFTGSAIASVTVQGSSKEEKVEKKDKKAVETTENKAVEDNTTEEK